MTTVNEKLLPLGLGCPIPWQAQQLWENWSYPAGPDAQATASLTPDSVCQDSPSPLPPSSGCHRLAPSPRPLFLGQPSLGKPWVGFQAFTLVSKPPWPPTDAHQHLLKWKACSSSSSKNATTSAPTTGNQIIDYGRARSHMVSPRHL